ncbi:MAG: DUF6056 family protein [Anaerolineaceae bacterium]
MKPRFQCPLDQNKTKRFFKIALILANLFLLIALTIYAYRGFFSRYWADDYCFGTIYNEHGLFEGTRFFYQNTSNRFAAYFLVGLNELFGVNAIHFLPTLMILVTVLIFTRVFHLLFRVIKIPQPWYSSLFLSQLLTYFMLLMAPNLFQSLFWRSGMVSYFAPIPCLGLTLIILLPGLLNGYNKWYGLVGIFLMAFFSAGLSETFAALETGLWVVLILSDFLFVSKKQRQPLLKGVLSALIGSLAAMGIMILAPGNSMRLATLEQASNLWQVIFLSLKFAASFAYHTLLGLPIPVFILFTTVLIFGYHLSGHGKLVLQESVWRKILLGSLIVGTILLVCVTAPTAYGMLAYPEERAWMLGRFVTVFTIIVAGFSAGILSHRWMDRFVDTCLVFIIILLVLSLYPLKGAWAEWQQIPKWQAIAQAWDVRHADIQQKVSAGETFLTVKAFDSIGTVAELTDDPNYWVNTCAATYYGVEEITAMEEIYE